MQNLSNIMFIKGINFDLFLKSEYERASYNSFNFFNSTGEFI